METIEETCEETCDGEKNIEEFKKVVINGVRYVPLYKIKQNKTKKQIRDHQYYLANKEKWQTTYKQNRLDKRTVIEFK